MKGRRRWTGITVLSLFAMFALFAATRIVAGEVHVDGSYDGSEGSPDGSQDRPFTTVAEAMAVGDRIVIHGGTYLENLTFSNVTLLGTGETVLHGLFIAEGSVSLVGLRLEPSDPGLMIVDLDHDGSPSDRALAWSWALGARDHVIVAAGDGIPDGPRYPVAIVTGAGIDPGTENALVSLTDRGGIVILDGPVLETTGTSRSSAIAPLVGCGWTFTPHPPTSLFSPVGFGGFGGPVAVNVTPLNGGYHYLDPCDDPALLTSHSGVWRPFVRLTDTGYILLAMPVAALEPSVRSALVDAFLGSLDVPALAAVSGELHLERTDIAGELLVDDAVADALDSEIERVRTNGGTLTERYTLTVHCEYHEGTPLRNIDLRVTADGDELYATEGFGGPDPSPDGDGNVTLAVPSSVHRDDGVRTLRVILESSSNWEHAGPLSLDGPTTVVLRSPDPSPRPVALRCELDGTDALLTWDLSRDIDFDHYLLEVDGPEGLTFNIIDGGERIVSLHDGSTYNVSIRVVDADGYRSMPTRIVVVTPNLPPPAPADLAAVAIDGSRLEVTWGRIAVPDLDHFTIAYTDLLVDIGSRGLADAALDTVDLPPDATSAVLEGLREGTTYRLLVAAVDVHGAVGRSAEVTVSMPVTPPQIHVVDPTPGGPVNDVVRLSGTASDDRLLVSVEYRVDDGEWRPAVGRDRWALIMSVGDLEEGHHDLQIKARDVSSNATISLPLEISHADDGRTGEVPVPTAYYALLSVATALVVLLLTESGLYLVFSALGLLYARITGRRVLDNYIRGKIHGYIIANPGDHYSSIMRKLGLSNGLFAYHVKVLERESLVKSVMDGRLRRFYPVGMKVVFERELDMLQVRILNIISENPGITQKEIASALGMRKQVVNLNVRAMYHEGLIDIVRSGRETHLYLISPEDARGSGDGASGDPPG